MTLPWRKRNRRQVRNEAPSLLERLNWRVAGIVAGVAAGVCVVALLLVLALDRPGPGSMVQRALLFYCETAASVCMWHRVCFQFLPLRVALNTGAIQRSGRKGKP